ncbi:MAG: hypothetical protein ABW123_13440, partial [Cystobacter sp.]
SIDPSALFQSIPSPPPRMASPPPVMSGVSYPSENENIMPGGQGTGRPTTPHNPSAPLKMGRPPSMPPQRPMPLNADGISPSVANLEQQAEKWGK